MSSYEYDFLKDDEERFNFQNFGVKFAQMSIHKEEIQEVEEFIDDLIF